MKELIKTLSDSVLNMDEDETVIIAEKCLKNNITAYEAIDKGLSDGMNRAGELYEQEEYYIPELLMCSDAMYAGLDVLKPHLEVSETQNKSKVVIGVVQHSHQAKKII